MITKDLQDDDVVKSIREFVRATEKFDFHEYIRRGCNGEVYFGTHKKFGDEVVLKFYWSYPHYIETEEAVILRGIDHENILKIQDLQFLPPNYAYFVSPKISGGDLQGIIDTKTLSTKEALIIVSGILLGLTELHSKHKLVHQDLKPGNILLHLNSNRPVIADLGAVKKIEKADGFVTASKSTYFYLPPESILNNAYYYQSDLYQVGLIMFQLLGGNFPLHTPIDWLTAREKKQLDGIKNSTDWQRKFDDAIASRIVKSTLADTDTLPDYLDPAFKRVVNKALHSDHTKRFNNPSLFLKEVHDLLRNHPSYTINQTSLSVVHDDGKEYNIYRGSRDELLVEKKLPGKSWRKEKNHDGTMKSALEIARKN